MPWSYSVGPVRAGDFAQADQDARNALHKEFEQYNAEALVEQIPTAAKAAAALVALFPPDSYASASVSGHRGGISISVNQSTPPVAAPLVEETAEPLVLTKVVESDGTGERMTAVGESELVSGAEPGTGPDKTPTEAEKHDPPASSDGPGTGPQRTDT